jgi:hypothetical protein
MEERMTNDKQWAVPRIRCRSAEIIDPPELRGKWAFEVSLWDFYGERQIGEPFGPYGAFDTQAQAIEESKRCAQMICDDIVKSMGEEPTGRYLDMKNGGVVRKWENDA